VDLGRFYFLAAPKPQTQYGREIPLDNYVKCLEAESDPERVRCRNDFLRDVRTKIKEVRLVSILILSKIPLTMSFYYS